MNLVGISFDMKSKDSLVKNGLGHIEENGVCPNENNVTTVDIDILKDNSNTIKEKLVHVENRLETENFGYVKYEYKFTSNCFTLIASEYMIDSLVIDIEAVLEKRCTDNLVLHFDNGKHIGVDSLVDFVVLASTSNICSVDLFLNRGEENNYDCITVLNRKKLCCDLPTAIKLSEYLCYDRLVVLKLKDLVHKHPVVNGNTGII